MKNYPEIDRYIELSETTKDRPYLAEVPREFTEIAERIGELTGTWNPVEIYTPSAASIAEEKAKFFEAYDAGQEYNPQFEYTTALSMNVAEEKSELERLMSDVHRLSPHAEKDRLFRVALRAKIMDDLATCDLVSAIKAQDDKAVGKALRQKYPPADDLLIAYAQEEASRLTLPKEKPAHHLAKLTKDQQEALKTMEFDAQQIKAAFEWALQRYDILRTPDNPDGYAVVISDEATAIDVRDKSKDPMTIYIPASRRVNGIKLCELMAHEIEGHARQSMNGVKMFMLGGGKLKMDDETLYEGLAKRNDHNFHQQYLGVDEGTAAPWYTLAAARANQGASFSKIFKEVLEFRLRAKLKIPLGQRLPDNSEATSKLLSPVWQTTYRVMRGHTNMANPHAFANNKDIGYLKGELMDKQLGAAGYGGINELAIIQSGGLQIIGRLGVRTEDMPYPLLNATEEYLMTILLPSIN